MKEALKGVRFALLKCEVTEAESEKLEKALSFHADLAVAHALKEQLSELWEQEDEESAFTCLADWISDAE